MSDQIAITGISGFGHHGVLESERVHGQNFSADVTIFLNTRAAGESDDL
ncbi:MAG: dihydroneopterin aldolase, partial [Actinobacteria bacterium]|nr:dihydroneopterin aldolase [Actinomycetota bacterium]